MPVDAVYLWLLTRVLFCCTRGLGCNAHPAFPAPSAFREGGSFQKFGRNASRERGLASAVLSWPVLRDAAYRPLLRTRSSLVARPQTLVVRSAAAPRGSNHQ